MFALSSNNILFALSSNLKCSRVFFIKYLYCSLIHALYYIILVICIEQFCQISPWSKDCCSTIPTVLTVYSFILWYCIFAKLMDVVFHQTYVFLNKIKRHLANIVLEMKGDFSCWFFSILLFFDTVYLPSSWI